MNRIMYGTHAMNGGIMTAGVAISVEERLRHMDDLMNQFVDEARRIDEQVQYEPVRRKTINLRVQINDLQKQIDNLRVSCENK